MAQSRCLTGMSKPVGIGFDEVSPQAFGALCAVVAYRLTHQLGRVRKGWTLTSDPGGASWQSATTRPFGCEPSALAPPNILSRDALTTSRRGLQRLISVCHGIRWIIQVKFVCPPPLLPEPLPRLTRPPRQLMSQARKFGCTRRIPTQPRRAGRPRVIG